MSKSSDFFQIAIDGPVAAGKGTVSRLLAEKLNFLYVDTGAMYRAAALLAIQNNINFDQEDKVVTLIAQSTLEMRNPEGDKEADGRLTTLILNGKDVSWAIRTTKCSDGASKVATLAKVRQILVEKQKKIAETQNVVMEGRDITFKVLPDADLKIFLTADLEIRAKRRHLQYLTKGIDKSIEEVIKEVQERDQRDMTRKIDPLHPTADSWILDSSHLSIEEVVNLIAEKVNTMIKKK
ncbi:MAG TPA: (d)CMP kinase [Candidatus Woesebacteria bacterium]|nr:(d)CMP kinase [Candidatus Woesebacteria bacterium]